MFPNRVTSSSWRVFLIHTPVEELSTAHSSSSLLALGLGDLLAAGLDAGKDVLAVLVEVQLGNDHVAGVDADGHSLTGGLLAGDTLDMDDVLEAVHRGDLALLVLVGAANDLDLVALADGDAPDLQRLISTLGLNPNLVREPTLYFSRSSLLSGALMMTRRTLEGAEKCALRALRREEETAKLLSIIHPDDNSNVQVVTY